MQGQNIILAILIVIMGFVIKNEFFSSPNEQTFKGATEICLKVKDRAACDIESIQEIIKNSNRNNAALVMTLDWDFIDKRNGYIFVEPDYGSLNKNQINVFKNWKKEHDKEISSDNKNMSSVYAIVMIILAIASLGAIVLILTPKIWRFILNRVSEVSDATKGKKF